MKAYESRLHMRQPTNNHFTVAGILPAVAGGVPAGPAPTR